MQSAPKIYNCEIYENSDKLDTFVEESILSTSDDESFKAGLKSQKMLVVSNLKYKNPKISHLKISF